MAQGKFIPIPLLIGANSDEGTSFGVSGLDNGTAIFNNLLAYRSYAISPPTARKLLELYPNDPAHEPPYYITNATIFPSKGLQWRRDCAIAGDIVMISGRRKTCEEYTRRGLPIFSYRFDTPLWNAPVTAGAQHFVNVVFSFQNISGALGPLPKYRNYTDLSHNIGKAYISFVNDLDPNTSKGNSTLPYWPRYTLATPQNMVLNSNRSYVEPDTFRKEGITFINTIDRELLA
jgi:cholinesterase